MKRSKHIVYRNCQSYTYSIAKAQRKKQATEWYIKKKKKQSTLVFSALELGWQAFYAKSVQFSRPVVSNSLWPYGLQHARPPCLSPTPRIYSNSCSLSQWYHPAISSSVVPFSSCPQSFPASGSFHMSQLFNQVAKALEFQLQHQSFQWIFRADFL